MLYILYLCSDKVEISNSEGNKNKQMLSAKIMEQKYKVFYTLENFIKNFLNIIKKKKHEYGIISTVIIT